MGVELRPLGVSCNLACTYCYQEPQRLAGNHRQSYDLDAMKEAVLAAGGPLTLFGGEPLLVDFNDLRDLLEWGCATFGETGIQTNGALITDAHIEVFERCRTQVGVSIDGPAELNDARRHPGGRTRSTTDTIHANLVRLVEGMSRPPGLIVTLHRANATAEHLPRMSEWFRDLERIGIRAVRLHVLEVDDPEATDLTLTPAENVAALLHFIKLEGQLEKLRFDVTSEFTTLLTGRDQGVSCVWRACDPYTTEAVQGVEGNGQSSNCGRTNKDGVDFVKADEVGFERYVALHATPQEHGGCQGCRFFLLCKGQCPGTSVGGDWRNRTEHCLTWKSLFTSVERYLLTRGSTPITLSSELPDLEAQMVQSWRDGRNPRIDSLTSPAVGPEWTPEAARPRAETRVFERDSVRRMDFRMHSFVRHSWVDSAARSRWEPRFTRIDDALGRLAVLSVAHGLARAAVRAVRPEWTFVLTQFAAEHDLALLVLQRGQGSFGAPPLGARPRRPLPQGVPCRDLVAIGTPRFVGVLARLHQAGRFAELEALLGYPEACRAFARRVFGDDDLRDATWAMASAGGVGGHRVEVPEGPYANVLLSKLGLEPVPFQPTSFSCPDARKAYERRRALGQAFGLGDALDDLDEILRWPMEWTALHGIAELKTPVLKVVRSTDATIDRLELRYLGTVDVEGRARGLRFPFVSKDGVARLPVLQGAP